MFVEQVIPLLVGIVVGVLLSVIVWSVLKTRQAPTGETTVDLQAQMLFLLLLIAVFGAGVFITYLLFRL
jgi:ABC-type amino acid transport system permease subunit